ncbi:MAG: PorT family protein [Bacteroidota bacterium]|nr:MAG: PorT family protein [Bacteroidota bacterium]
MKQLAFAFIFISLSFQAYTQELKFGVYLAPQVSWLLPEAKDVQSNGNLLRISGGLAIDRYFAKNYAFSTGLAIGSQGGYLLYDGSSSRTLQVYDSTYAMAGKSVKYQLHYLSLPLGLKLRSNEIGYMRFHVVLGFQNQFLLKAKGTDETDNAFQDDSIRESLANYNLGYYFGGGIDYALGEDTSLFFTIVYDNGFIDILKNNPPTNTRGLGLRVGINF